MTSLGHEVTREGTQMNLRRIEATVNWEPPKNATGVRSFRGFAEYYRRFVEGFSKLVMP